MRFEPNSDSYKLCYKETINSAQTYESLVLSVGCFFDNDKLGLLMIINIFHGTINRPALLYVFRVYCFLAGILLDINCYYSHKGNDGHC